MHARKELNYACGTYVYHIYHDTAFVNLDLSK